MITIDMSSVTNITAAVGATLAYGTNYGTHGTAIIIGNYSKNSKAVSIWTAQFKAVGTNIYAYGGFNAGVSVKIAIAYI